MKKTAPKLPPPIPREALRWTETVEPDVLMPTAFMGLAKGFLHNAYSMRVEPACSSSVGHSFGRDDKTDTQQPRLLFSTRLRALQAMRNEAERQAARKLHEIDLMIAAIRTDSTA